MRQSATATLSVRMVAEDAAAFRLDVQVTEGEGKTRHGVTLARSLLGRLSPAESAEDFVRRSFEFLLQREPKESILRQFDVSVIARYFPEYELEIALGTGSRARP